MTLAVKQLIAVLELMHAKSTLYANTLKNCPKNLQIALKWFGEEINCLTYMAENNLAFKKTHASFETFLDVRISYWTTVQTMPWALAVISQSNRTFAAVAEWVLTQLERIKKNPTISLSFLSQPANLASQQSVSNQKQTSRVSFTLPPAKPPSLTLQGKPLTSQPSIPTFKLG